MLLTFSFNNNGPELGLGQSAMGGYYVASTSSCLGYFCCFRCVRWCDKQKYVFAKVANNNTL